MVAVFFICIIIYIHIYERSIAFFYVFFLYFVTLLIRFKNQELELLNWLVLVYT